MMSTFFRALGIFAATALAFVAFAEGFVGSALAELFCRLLGPATAPASSSSSSSSALRFFVVLDAAEVFEAALAGAFVAFALGFDLVLAAEVAFDLVAALFVVVPLVRRDDDLADAAAAFLGGILSCDVRWRRDGEG